MECRSWFHRSLKLRYAINGLTVGFESKEVKIEFGYNFGLDFCVVVSTKVDFVGGSTSSFIDSLLSISALGLDLVFTGVFSLE